MKEPSIGRVSVFLRFTRIRFIPVMLAPLAIGIGSARYLRESLNPLFVSLVIIGSIFLHLAANSIDDVYDFINGVDQISDKMFPRDFPGWKPLTRGLISVNEGYAISFIFYSLSLVIGVYLSVVVGWLALIIAVPGIILSYFYVAPPLKLDYRGFGLGELSILLSFGPIPSLGAFYVLTGSVNALPVLAGIPAGLLTVNVLLSHDMIFYDAYRVAGKKSLAVLLGRVKATRLSIALGAIAYLSIVTLVALTVLPISSLLALLALPLFLRKADFKNQELPPPMYGPRTTRMFLHSVLFSLLLTLGLLL
jgi:1,4-dihydroxy-2-naphthoate octaprenyltransferase